MFAPLPNVHEKRMMPQTSSHFYVNSGCYLSTVKEVANALYLLLFKIPILRRIIKIKTWGDFSKINIIVIMLSKMLPTQAPLDSNKC